MGIYISRIGSISYIGTINKVKLFKGFNIITGVSQTGKTALMEIVDYCLLNSTNNIPKGIIDEKSQIYFITLVKNQKKIIIGREKFEASKERNGRLKAFLKYEDISFDEDTIGIEYFTKNERNFKSIQELKIDFLEIFNINVLERIAFDNKIQRPTHRNIMSFIFQTQGIIANKENLFYRMNDFRKRKLLIDELPILLGFVDQEYNIKRLEKIELEKEIKKIEEKINYSLEEIEELENIIDAEKVKLSELKTNEKIIILDPKIRTNILNQKKILEKKLSNKAGKLLEIQFRLEDIGDIDKEKIKLKEKIDNRLKNDFENVSNCPFCDSKLDKLNDEIKSLQKIKNEYNDFVSKESTLNATLLKNKMLLEKQEKRLKKEIEQDQDEYCELLDILNEEENNSEKIREQVEYKKLRLESLERRKKNLCTEKLEIKLKELKDLLDELNFKLKQVDISDKMKRMNVEIAQEMERIIKKLDFEKYLGYPQININLEKLEYYQMNDREKIYLSAMGSGSNWLAVHIALFLALNFIFSKYSSTVSIPNILFLDQPSQVYFPQKNINNEDKDSNDYKNVENIFIQILDHVEHTKKNTGEEPQIILIDHADRLNLGMKYNFEDYVRARWDKEKDGFIKE